MLGCRRPSPDVSRDSWDECPKDLGIGGGVSTVGGGGGGVTTNHALLCVGVTRPGSSTCPKRIAHRCGHRHAWGHVILNTWKNFSIILIIIL